MTDQSPKLVLVDGSSFLFRAYHAIPPLTNSSGEPTNAIYGVANMLRKLLDDHQTDYVTVVFDAPGKTFRHELYHEYKANRPAMPDDLRQQIEPLHQLIRIMGLPLIVEHGVEADDVLGALAFMAADKGFQVVISTGDKDMAQLVNPHISLENTMSGSFLDEQGVMDKFGVKPDQIIDYLALMGDKVDNIPGVPKVGPKTAAKWLGQYESLQNLMEHADEIGGKVGENLRSSLQQLPLSRELTTIKVDLDLPYLIADLKCKPVDTSRLKQQLQYFGFSAWLKTLNELNPSENVEVEEKSQIDAEYETILTQEHFQQWLDRLANAEIFAFDTETTSLNYSEAEIVGLSFAVKAGNAAYLPLAHDYSDAPEQLERADVLQQLKPLLEDEACLKVGQNLKYDANVLANYDVFLNGVAHDTMLQSYVYNSTATRHNMDDLAKYYLNIETIHYEDVAGKGVKQIGFNAVPIEQAAPYAAEDADITLRLFQLFSEKLKQIETLESVYQQLEIPLLPVLSRIERNGVLLDMDMLGKQSQKLAESMKNLEHQAYVIAGQEFNLSSPKQIQEILFEQLNLPVLKKTPKGQPSTAESVLQELALDYALPRLILEHRSFSKLKSTYTDKLPLQLNPKTGRVHTSYHQAVAATGRLSSSDPNLQNIPVRSEEGRRIRQAFIAAEDCQILAADYSQIELRIMAHLSADENLLTAFSNGDDIHRATAAEVFAVAFAEVDQSMRRSAKAINFGLIYGMSAFGLAKQLGVSRAEAQSYIDLYFNRYPGVKRYMDEIRDQARESGYVETLFGRRLYLPEIQSRNAARRQYAERTAINAPMQGTAADIIKSAMIEVDQWIQDNCPSNKMIMQVHDELVFEVKKAEIAQFSDQINRIMCNATSLDVPLLVDIGIGDNWDEAH